MTDRPWMTALEMQFGSLGVVRRLARLPDVPHSVTDAHVLRELAAASPFAWSSETTQAVWLASKSIPLSAQFDRDLLPDGLRSAFWWLDFALPIPPKNPENWQGEEDAGLDMKSICSLLISRDLNENWVISCGRMSDIGIPFMVEVNQLHHGCSLRDMTSPEALHLDTTYGTRSRVRDRDIELFRFVLAASVWLKQRIVTMGSGHIERHRRKQIVREYGIVPSDVKVIQLRRHESEHHESPVNSRPVDWSCRWIVNGHWRNQPYKDKHELIYIMPYVKGPEDQPLKVPSHTVYAVNR
jgi:hypothetical protein